MRSSVLGFGGLLVAALLLQTSSAQHAAAPAPSSALERARVLTGGESQNAWFAERFALALEVLRPNVPEPARARAVALSLVAQWAHETGRGRAEFCFNLGGWTARPKDPFFVGRDAGGRVFRWTAYADLPNAVADQVQRLHDRYPAAWNLLLAQPTTSAWVEELGRRGYYTATPAAYAQAWAMNRAELGRLVS